MNSSGTKRVKLFMDGDAPEEESEGEALDEDEQDEAAAYDPEVDTSPLLVDKDE